VLSYSEERKIACKVRDELAQIADSPYIKAQTAPEPGDAKESSLLGALGSATARTEGTTSSSSNALMRLDAVTPSSQAEAARRAREVMKFYLNVCLLLYSLVSGVKFS
jgi:hypothetical protein